MIIPTLGSVNYTNGRLSFTVTTGTTGPDYIVLTSTNPANWVPIYTNSSPTAPFTFVDINAAVYPAQFYRVQLAP